ncbi:MAG: hypothetical protein GW859_09875 [Sphingomonadales bacterium]|nr:hypothetical protein [Sphingomonadales bacterium]
MSMASGAHHLGEAPIETSLVPLAMTLPSASEACVAGIDDQGAWVRPSPVPAHWIAGPRPLFAYRRASTLRLGPPPRDGARPEDRALIGRPRLSRSLSLAAHRRLLDRAADGGVDAAFAGDRSAGLIRARLRDVYARRHTRGRFYLRLVFDDASGETFDWILPDIAAVGYFAEAVADGALAADARRCWLDAHRGEAFLAIGLTLPTRAPDRRFRGCNPLVVGVHGAAGGAA